MNADDARVQMIKDAHDFVGGLGLDATTAFTLGFFNALLLAGEAPEVATRLYEMMSADIARFSGQQQRVITTRQRVWLQQWRRLMASIDDVKGART